MNNNYVIIDWNYSIWFVCVRQTATEITLNNNWAWELKLYPDFDRIELNWKEYELRDTTVDK